MKYFLGDEVSKESAMEAMREGWIIQYIDVQDELTTKRKVVDGIMYAKDPYEIDWTASKNLPLYNKYLIVEHQEENPFPNTREII